MTDVAHTRGAWFDEHGNVVAERLAQALQITEAELAVATGLPRDAVTSPDGLRSLAAQQRLRQVTDLLTRIESWAGALGAAWAWYRSYPIPPLGHLTAEALVAAGRADEVRAYFTHISEGGYA
ncbi:XRE family transcriptional regulator [Aquisalimonas sp. 2447]|uniref:XRE family transcriptional regulator n=1 Tax=Aquisalimonas sp. 2447 TaxID=2740807 RepID=UPI0014323867|nr:XRE family transcriptional regulator [Aquisalimonas sp. 2447]QIT55887.1 XRE family transcriptional regulator [Aquisalimonas sp. 2447]